MEKGIGKNRVLIGKKSKSTYLQTILYIFNNNSVDSISVEGLGRQSQKALEVAEKAGDLVKQIEMDEIENIERNGVGGMKITLEIVEEMEAEK